MDYSFHQIITDASDDVIFREVPEIVASGVRSLKVFLTYDPLHLDDRQFLRVLAAARRTGALVTVHCENYEAIRWRTEALLAAGYTAPKYHAWSRPSMIEREAAHRAIALAEMVDQPIQIFHVSCPEVADEIARAQARGLKVWGETCPQYFVLSAQDMDRPGFEGAKFMCSPAPRDAAASEGLWGPGAARPAGRRVVGPLRLGIRDPGRQAGERGGRAVPATFRTACPGLAARLAHPVQRGRGEGPHRRQHLRSHYRLQSRALVRPVSAQGHHCPRGADADLVLWDPTRKTRLTNALMQHVIDYTPYEGLEVTGWPVTTIRRGEVVMRDGKVQAEPGSGQFLARAPYEMIRPTGRLPDGFDASAFLV